MKMFRLHNHFPLIPILFLIACDTSFCTELPVPAQITESAQTAASPDPLNYQAPPPDHSATKVTNPPKTTAEIIGPKHVTLRNLFLGLGSTISLSGDNSIAGADIDYRFGDATEWKRYTSPLSLAAMSEGPFTLHIRSKVPDSANEQTDVSFIVDATAPVSVLTIGSPQVNNPDGGTYVSTSTPFSLEATDNSSGVGKIEYRIENGDWSIYREPFKFSDEGVQRLEYRAVDNLGNQEPSRNARIIVDSTPPITFLTTGTQRSDSTGILYLNRPLSVTLSATDMLSGVKLSEYRIDQGRWIRYSEPFTVDDRSPHTITYRSIDNAGNEEAIKTISAVIDKTPPVTTLTAGSPQIRSASGSLVVSESTFFSLAASDSQSGVIKIEYSVDGGGWLPYTPFTLQLEGVHHIEYRSTDNSGNQEVPKKLEVTVSTTPPLTTASSAKKRYETGDSIISASDVSLTLAVTGRQAPVKSTEYRIDNGEWTLYKPFQITNEGSHFIEFRSTDLLGNQEPTRFVSVIIDRQPPATALMIGQPKTEENGVIQITDKTPIALSSTDTIAGVTSSSYRIVGAGGERSGTEPFSIVSDGEYLVAFSSVDRAGNREVEKTVRLRVSIPKPPPPPAQLPVKKPSEMTDTENTAIRHDSEIPDSIRIAGNKEIAKDTTGVGTGEKSISDESIDALYGNSLLTTEFSPRHHPAKEYWAIGGINLAVILAIFLLL